MTTILLVDDEPDLLAVLAILLDLEGFGVLTASDGERALEIVRKSSVDLVLTDLMMPVMDGLTLCRQLRAHPATQRVPIILNSASASKPEGEGELFDTFLSKSVRFQELLAQIRRLLAPATP